MPPDLGGVAIFDSSLCWKAGIYELRHPDTGPYYVGMSAFVGLRLADHLKNYQPHSSIGSVHLKLRREKREPILAVLEWLDPQPDVPTRSNAILLEYHRWLHAALGREKHWIALRLSQGYALVNIAGRPNKALDPNSNNPL